jgi:hypothetical protein
MEILRGEDHQVRIKYLEYEDILGTLARLEKLDNRQIRQAAISKQLVELLYKMAHSAEDKTAD